jgi:membrane protein DedA with SNARE-associated domain
MPYRRFFLFNVIGGVAWAAVFTLAGYVAGESYARVGTATGWGSWLLGGAVLGWIAVCWAMRRRRARTSDVPAACDDEVTASIRDEVLI